MLRAIGNVNFSLLTVVPVCHLVGVDPSPEALWNPELELHPILVTRLAHWGQKGGKAV